MSWGDTQFTGHERFGFATVWSLAPAWLVRRIVLTYAGIILPIICFALTWDRPVDSPQWQSGSLSDYAAYLQWGGTTFLFFPLLGYSMVCLGLAVFQVRRATDKFFVRAGVYTGVLLAMHYSVLLAAMPLEEGDWTDIAVAWICFLGAASIVAAIGIGGVYLLISVARWSHFAVGAWKLWSVIGMLLVLVAGVSIVERSGELAAFFVELPLLPVGISLVFAPFLTLFAYAFVSRELLRMHWPGGQFRLWQMLLAFSWLGAYMGACRAAIQIAIAEYAKLPTEPPGDCYIATAAARGHMHFVRSRPIVTTGGETMLTNRQLQTLKSGELAIRTVCPRLHRRMRLVYDCVGPRLARRLRHPLLADAAYLSLKPFEWATRIALRCLGVTLPQDRLR